MFCQSGASKWLFWRGKSGLTGKLPLSYSADNELMNINELEVYGVLVWGTLLSGKIGLF